MMYSEELLRTLLTEPAKLREFKGAIANFHFHDAEWKRALQNNTQEPLLSKLRRAQLLHLKKVLALNTPYDETKHIMQILYGTERYAFLSNKNIDEVLQCYLTPLLGYSYIRDVWDFVERLKRTIEVNDINFETNGIYLNSRSSISREELFADKDDVSNDVTTLLGAMKAREELCNKDKLRESDIQRGAIIEFIIWMLTQTSHFTYDIKKARNKPHPKATTFYVGPDREEMINNF